MDNIRYTLVTEGSSDATLLTIIQWLLRENLSRQVAINGTWADFRLLYKPPTNLAEKIQKSIELYPCNLMFIHRDADNESVEDRAKEVVAAIQKAQLSVELPVIFVIPVRMLEAWLLFDELAIRFASGNPNGKAKLNLPSLQSIERYHQPKELLFELLRQASELSPHRLRKFNVYDKRRLVAEYISDFSVLRALSAFQYLEAQIQEFTSKL